MPNPEQVGWGALAVFSGGLFKFLSSRLKRQTEAEEQENQKEARKLDAVEKLFARIESLEKRLETVESEKDAATERAHKAELELSVIKGRVDDLVAHVDRLETRTTAQDKELANQENQILQLGRDLEDRDETISELEQSIEDLEARLTAETLRAEELQALLDDANKPANLQLKQPLKKLQEEDA